MKERILKTQKTGLLLISVLAIVLMGAFIGSAFAKDGDDFSYFPCPASLDGKKWGYIDKTGKWIIKPRFEEAKPFKDGLALVNYGDKSGWGFINEKGESVINFSFEFININAAYDRFREGLMPVAIRRGKDIKMGVIDKTGAWVIEPKFEDIDSFKDGVAAAYVIAGKREEGWWRTRNEGDIRKLSGIRKDGALLKCGFIDKTGAWIIEPRFASCGSYYSKERLASIGDIDSIEVLVTGRMPKYGFADMSGNIVIEPQFRFIGDFHEGLARAMIWDAASEGNKEQKWGYIDKTGKFVIEPRFDYANDFCEGLAQVSIGDFKAGYIDKKGKFVIEPKYSWGSEDFSNGLALVFTIGWIEKLRAWVIEPKYSSDSEGVIDNLAPVFTDGKPGVKYIDKKGKTIIRWHKRSRTWSFINGMAMVCLDARDPHDIQHKCGFIDKKGKWVIKPIFKMKAENR